VKRALDPPHYNTLPVHWLDVTSTLRFQRSLKNSVSVEGRGLNYLRHPGIGVRKKENAGHPVPNGRLGFLDPGNHGTAACQHERDRHRADQESAAQVVNDVTK